MAEEHGEGSAVDPQRSRRDGRRQADVSRRLQARSLPYESELMPLLLVGKRRNIRSSTAAVSRRCCLAK